MAATSKVMREVGRLSSNNAVLFVCDIQEKFRQNIAHFEAMTTNSARLVNAFTLLEAPIIATEQYPKGLGKSVAELGFEQHGITPTAKTSFSMCVPEVVEALAKTERRSVVVCGIECHVCVQQTVLHLIEDGFNVHVVADAVSSRSQTDRMVALGRMRSSGAFLTTTEAVVLGLAGGSGHPAFKGLQKIILEPSADTGLLPHLSL